MGFFFHFGREVTIDISTLCQCQRIKFVKGWIGQIDNATSVSADANAVFYFAHILIFAASVQNGEGNYVGPKG